MAIRILHVASFHGNVGDNASHNGLYRLFKHFISHPIQVHRQEIRKAYLNYDGADRWRWDTAFARYANSFDLVVVGGGNYFAPWLESSSTGTTVDISLDVLAKIRTPIIFHSLGFDPYKGIAHGAIEKFSRFIEAVLSQEKNLIALRNDGSYTHFTQLLGRELAERVLQVPDTGFFAQIDGRAGSIVGDNPYIALNLANDMLDTRFPASFRWSYDSYLADVVAWLTAILTRHEGLALVLVPHIASDVLAIGECVARMPEWLTRTRLTVAGLRQGPGSEQAMLNIYRNAVLSTGNRFHTNVCSIALGVPTVGISTYQKLVDLYSELQLSPQVVTANAGPFASELTAKAEEMLSRSAEHSSKRQAAIMDPLWKKAALEFIEIENRI